MKPMSWDLLIGFILYSSNPRPGLNKDLRLFIYLLFKFITHPFLKAWGGVQEVKVQIQSN